MIYMIKVIHYCLQMYSEVLGKNLMKYMNLILFIFYLLLDWPLKAYLEMTGVELELQTDNDMLMMTERGIRG